MKKTLALILSLIWMLSLSACLGSGSEESTAKEEESRSPESSEETTAEETTEVPETRATYDSWLPREYEEDNRGLLLRIEFPQRTCETGMDIKGTLLLKNETGAPLNSYLHLRIDVLSYPDRMGDGGLPSVSLAFSETRESYVTTGLSNAELFPITLSEGEEITVDFTMEGNEALFLQDIETFYFSVVLCEDEAYASNKVLYGFYLPIECQYIQ